MQSTLKKSGLDAAAPAVFLALLWPSLRRREARWVGLGGAGQPLALVPIAPPGIPVVAAAVAALVGGILPDRAAAQQIDESGRS